MVENESGNNEEGKVGCDDDDDDLMNGDDVQKYVKFEFEETAGLII